MKRILVVDDDPAVAESLTMRLQLEGYDVAAVGDGEAAVAAFREQVPDLIILDLMLPGIDGIEVCRTIRSESGVPIVMLTARGETDELVRGLEAGADDYVIKPPNPDELLARLRARLRASTIEPGSVLRVVDLVIDTTGHTVRRGEQQIMLTPLEFSLLVALAQRPGEVFTRERLLKEVWEYQHAADTRLVNVHVQRLRSKIEKDPEHPEIVITVRGIGYKAGH
jgi:two-component system response regulator MtrA